MIGIVIVTHGGLARAFEIALETRLGAQEALEPICIGPDDDMEQRRRDIVAAVERVERGHGVILITDMFGGTPSNLAISILDRPRVEVIAGLNLPMLLALVPARGDRDLATAVEAARAAAFDGVTELGEPAGTGPSGTAAVGLVVVGHGRLAVEFQSATEHVVGPQERMEAVGAASGDLGAIAEAVEACDAGTGVVLCVDAAEGAAADAARRLVRAGDVRAIAGVNLPMLIKLASTRDQDGLPRLVASGLEAGRKYINVASRLLAIERS